MSELVAWRTRCMNSLILFCLIVTGLTATAFSIKFASSDAVDDRKKFTKSERTPKFDDLAMGKSILSHVYFRIITINNHQPVLTGVIDSLVGWNKPTISDIFAEVPPKTIYIMSSDLFPKLMHTRVFI
ncbi:hypothetical protein EC991_003504 [Linnemannia zychae]|nr:hypothetical protein EC991_003504 [Linnemannia zychae]